MREFIKLSFNKRFRTIFFLFISFVWQFWRLGKKKKRMKAEEVDKRYKALYKKQARIFTDTAIEMGGLLIKLGQFFSSRVDILPQEYTDELAKLQDSVKAVDTDIMIRRVEEELSGPIDQLFSFFSREPLAAASLGQVHQAKLPGGEEVAVKILRPGIEEIVAIDMETLKIIIAFAKRNARVRNSVDLDQIYREFRETIFDELDYRKEGQSADRFRSSFSEDEQIHVPEIYWSYTTTKVLTMEFIEGIKISEFGQLDKAGINRAKVAETLLSAYLKQVLADGFFHADPHPGNLLVQKDGRLVFLDFGMVGSVDQDMRTNMIELVIGVFKKDAGAVVESFDKLGFLRPHADRSTILKSVKLMLGGLFGEAQDMSRTDFGELSIELRDLMYSQPFQLPARTTFLGKAMITIMGICNGLDEDFDMMKILTPYMAQDIFDGNDMSPQGLVLDQIQKTLLEVVNVPAKLNRFMDGLETGELRFHPARSFERNLMEHQTHLANRIVFSVLTSGFMISGTILISGTMSYLGIAFLTVGGFSGLTLLRGRKTTAGRRARGMGAMGTGFKKPRFHP